MQRSRLAIVVVSVVVSLATAGPAQADANDQQYLDLLKANGLACGESAFDCPQGDDSMIMVGHQICTQLKANSKRSIAALIIQNKPGVQPQQAAALVAAAESSYCPRG